MLMVIAVTLTTSGPTLGQQLVVAPWLIHARMDIHQEPDEHRYKQRSGQDVGADNVEREIGQQDQSKAFHDIQLIGDLWEDLAVVMVCSMQLSQVRHFVQCQVEPEKDGVVDEDTRGQLEDQLSTTRRCTS